MNVSSYHQLMEAVIESYIDCEEKYESEKCEDQERWERYELTGEAISHEAATAWLGKLAQGEAAKCPK